MNNEVLNSVWEEKYRPTAIADIVGNPEQLKIFQNFIDQQDVNNILLFGKPGGGKTTIAKILMHSLDCEYLFINGSAKTGIDNLRGDIKTFCQTRSFKKFKLVVVDEADRLSMAFQDGLKSFMETYIDNTRFIFTCNNIGAFSDAIISRFQTYNIQPPSLTEVYDYFVTTLEKEEVEIADETELQDLILNFAPDMRRIFKSIQKNSSNGIFKLVDNVDSVSDSYKSKLIELLKNRGKWVDMRNLLIEAGVVDFLPLYQLLFNEVDSYLANKKEKGTALKVIAEYMYRSSFVGDKEINFSALLIELIELNYV